MLMQHGAVEHVNQPAGMRDGGQRELKGSGRPENQKIMENFRELMEQSRHYFSRLRDLPLYSNTPWQHYFHKAFQVYSMLWKYQQEHRQVLTLEGLERWDIGEIASKIGQLYFNYYLRTSELRFLVESYTFYDAIRRRQYFSNTPPQTALHSLCHLRYYARFMIVCLLLNKQTDVWQFMNELQALIQTHSQKFQEAEAHEWSMVMSEIAAFLEAETLVPNVKPMAPPPFVVSKRLSPDERKPEHKMCLSEVMILSYYHGQLKIAELPVDAFRILQALEWEVQAPGLQSEPDSLRASHALAPAPDTLHNPQKQLIYRSKITRVMAQLSAAIEELPVDKYLCIYLAANAPAPSALRPGDVPSALEMRATELGSRGVLMHPPPFAQRRGRAARPAAPDSQENTAQQNQIPPDDAASKSENVLPIKQDAPLPSLPNATDPDQVLVPEDLIPMTRKRLFMIVDSDNSSVFAQLHEKALSFPALLLLSPTVVPQSMPSASKVGALFTLFLSVPVHAVAIVCHSSKLDAEKLHTMQLSIDRAMQGLDKLPLPAFADESSPWSTVLYDTFLRRLVLRFVLCQAILAQLDEFAHEGCMPQAVPPLPECLDARSPIVKELADAVIQAAQ